MAKGGFWQAWSEVEAGIGQVEAGMELVEAGMGREESQVCGESGGRQARR